MKPALDRIYEALSAVPPVDAGRPVYSVGPVPGFPGYFVGKDSDERACILITVADRDARHHAPESLEVQFELRSLVRSAGQIAEGTFTLIRCRSSKPEIIRYFLSVGETILRILGAQPARGAIAQAINRLALIFQRLQNPPSRSVNVPFGELFLIRQSRNPSRALAAWRVQESSRFDFSSGDIRLDVKTASGRIRAHTFSYDQCNPPPATIAVVASLFVERAAGGISLRALVREIESLAGASAELVMKLHDIISATLGNALQEALSIRFDQKIAVSSLRFYDLRSVPAIRGDPPAGVSDIHFRSDLSALTGTPVEALLPAIRPSPIFFPVLTPRKFRKLALRRQEIRARQPRTPSPVRRLPLFQARQSQHGSRTAADALRRLHVPNSIGAPLFLFATRDELRAADPLTHEWPDGNGRAVRLI